MSELEKIGYTHAGNDPKRATRDGKEYEVLFPVPDWHEKDLLKKGTVEDTVAFMRKIIKNYAWQTKDLSQVLKGENLYQTCKNIWNFLYDHIKYKEDDEGQEQLRTPAVSWSVRTSRGIDCDDFSIFAGTILFNLHIPFYIRIAKYPDSLNLEKFSHVYVVVPNTEKRYIVIDAVLNKYDAEKAPIKEHKDFLVMEKANLNGVDITLLSGIDDEKENEITELVYGAWFPQRGELDGTNQTEEELQAVFKHLVTTRNLIRSNPGLIKNNEDPQSFLKMLDYAIQYWNTDKREEALAILAEKEYEINDLQGLGEFSDGYEEFSLFYGIEGLNGIAVLGRVKKTRAFFTKVKETVKKAGEGIKNGVKTAFKEVIKYSPITVGARAGMLLALKLNIGKMAERLKWGFLTEEEAKRHGFDIPEWRKLRERLIKSEKIYVDTMQGEAKNFKEAILTGRAGGLAGLFSTEDQDLGVEPVTASATLIATALPFIKKIIDFLKDVDMSKLTAKVKVDLLKKTQKAAETANPIPQDVKTALPDNNVSSSTQIEVKPEGQNNTPVPTQNVAPTPTTKTDSSSTTPEQVGFFTEAMSWVKENPGKSLLIAGGLVLAVSSKARSMVGLGIVTGKGRKKKGNKKNNPPKTAPAQKKKKSTGKKGKGGNRTIHL